MGTMMTKREAEARWLSLRRVTLGSITLIALSVWLVGAASDGGGVGDAQVDAGGGSAPVSADAIGPSVHAPVAGIVWRPPAEPAYTSAKLPPRGALAAAARSARAPGHCVRSSAARSFSPSMSPRASDSIPLPQHRKSVGVHARARYCLQWPSDVLLPRSRSGLW